jgi:hypothetical protein
LSSSAFMLVLNKTSFEPCYRAPDSLLHEFFHE